MDSYRKFLERYMYALRKNWVWPDPFSDINPYDVGAKLAWEFCESRIPDFKIQKILFDVKKYPITNYLFKENFHTYVTNKDSNFCKYCWLMNDYFLNEGLNYPIQMNFHYRQWDDRWLVNPGWLRYYIAHMAGETQMEAFYQPLVDSGCPVLKEYRSVEELTYDYGVDTVEKTFIVLTWFYGKPLMQVSFNPDVPIRDKYQHVEYYENIHKNIFHSNLQKGKLLYDVSDTVKDKIIKEVNTWPEEYKSLITFDDDSYARVTLEEYTDDSFYCGLPLVGTRIKNLEIKKLGLTYSLTDQ
jgi:hypothetical protein